MSEAPTLLYPRERFGRRSEPDSFDRRNRSILPHDHFVSAERVAIVEKAIRDGHDLTEAAAAEGGAS